MTTSSREALATGDVRALLGSLGPDNYEEYTVVSPYPGTPDGVIIWARVGRALILIEPNGETLIRVHDHAPDRSDEECWQENARMIGARVSEVNAEVQAIRENPLTAYAAALRGLLSADQGEDTVPIPAAPLPAVGQAAVPVRYVSDDGPTGMYL